MGEESPQYTLRCQLFGHEEDVRGLCVSGDGEIATGSRDTSIRIWNTTEGNKREYTMSKTLVGHTSFVGPVRWLPPTGKFPGGGLVSGGMDMRVIVWDLVTASIVEDLKGHMLQVSSIAVDANGDILSASVDSTVRRWRDGKTVETLQGHQGPVQAVLALPTGEVVTGSSDMTIKIWRGSTCVHTLSGHTDDEVRGEWWQLVIAMHDVGDGLIHCKRLLQDTVRGLALIPNVGILSASHDGTIRLWAQTGEQLLEMVGHTAIVYSVASHSSGDIASGSEDGYAKIWRGGTCIQSIEHPGCVWDVCFLPNGDLVTACSDGVARVWTREKQHCAPAEELQAYQSLIVDRKSAAKSVGGVKVDDLPGLEALAQPGTKDGQTRIVREGDTGVAYSWSLKHYTWEKVGEVVDGPNSNEKKTLHGVTYDYVFDVDIGDGLPTRKLPFNRGQNPYDVADKWLEEEELSPGYRQQVVEFIIQNTGGSTAPPRFDPMFVDPYTGGGVDVNLHLAANAYVPGQQHPSAPPLFGTNGTTTAGYAPTFKHVPKTGMLLFDTAQFEGITKKLTEFNKALSSDEAHKGLALSQGETMRIHAMLATLKDTSRYHSSSFADIDFKLLSNLLLQWPVQYIFPALDILRLMLLHPQCAAHYAEDANNGNDVILEALRRATSEPVLMPNLLTSARASANCFKHSSLRSWTIDHRSEVLDLFSECCTHTHKNVRLAYCTLVLNYTVLLLETKDDGAQMQVLSAALEMAGPQEQDAEVQFRSLVTLGTLIHSGDIKSVALDLDVKSLAMNAMKSPVVKIAEVGRDIETLLK